MARYIFTGLGSPEPVEVERELDLQPPYDLPTVLRLRANASELLREDERFATCTHVEARTNTSTSTEPLARVDRAHLTAAAPARSATGGGRR